MMKRVLCENTNYLTYNITMNLVTIQVETIIILITHININDRKTLNIKTTEMMLHKNG